MGTGFADSRVGRREAVKTDISSTVHLNGKKIKRINRKLQEMKNNCRT